MSIEQPAAFPPLLVDPPWRKRAKPTVVTGLRAPEIPVAVRWAPGEREEWLSIPFDRAGDGDWAGVADRLRGGEPVDWRTAVGFFVAAPEELARPLLADWRPAPECGDGMRRIAARFEIDALPALKRLSSGALLPFSAPDLPWRMVRSRAWLDRHPRDAAEYFVPGAVGPVNPARRMAELGLVTLIDLGHVDTVRRVAESYGPEPAAVVELLVGKDVTAILPGKLPPIPKWVDPARLPSVRLRRSALVLPTAMLRDLAMVFALDGPTDRYPGVAVVQEACEPADLTRFAWALFEAWESAGADGRHGWALDALGVVGDDDTVRRLTPRIMKWPGQNGHIRAVTGLGVLAAIGTEVALWHLHQIAERAEFPGLRSSAQQRLDRLAEDRGLTYDQLADRLVPPDTRAAEADEARRLERAMLTGRRWPQDEFQIFLAEHPLLRRLVWGRYDVKGVLTGGFRVAEDGTYADVHDRATTIGGGEEIGVAHPIHLGATLPQWSQVFADYQILQPFPQLGREIAALTEAEAAGVVLTRFQGRRVSSRAVLGLERRGWVRGTMADSRTQTSVSPSLTHALDLEFEPGIVHGAVDRFPEQTLGPITLYSRVDKLGDLDPVVISEMIRDLEWLTGLSSA